MFVESRRLMPSALLASCLLSVMLQGFAVNAEAINPNAKAMDSSAKAPELSPEVTDTSELTPKTATPSREVADAPSAEASAALATEALAADSQIAAEFQNTDEPMATLAALALNGSWELVSGRYLDGEGHWVDYTSLDLVAIKVLSNGHFSFTTIQKEDNHKQIWAAGAGKYRIEANQYIEYPSLTSFEMQERQSFSFAFELIGDEWHTRRTEDGELKEVEVWRRLD